MERRMFQEYGGRKDRKRGEKNVRFPQKRNRGQSLEEDVKRKEMCEIWGGEREGASLGRCKM